MDGVNNSKTAIQNDCLIRLYDADAELKAISTELDSFDGKKDPIRCNLLVNQLRIAQDKVISLLFQLMDECNCERAPRDYRMKFPDEILLSEGSESLNGQIWFGAECLSAGSNILNHTKESTLLRPMAKTLTTHLDSLRNDLRELVTGNDGASRINQTLIKKMVAFDHIFAKFEYDYVRTMLPIRTVAEIEKLQEVAVLFSETLIDCVKRGLIKQDDIEEFQPIVMIAIPRLAIVRGLLYKNDNPIYTRHKSHMCNLFQPFHGPLHSIRKLLRGLKQQELFCLEKMLANDQSAIESPLTSKLEPSVSNSRCNQCPQAEIREETGPQLGESNSEEAGTSNNYTNILMDGLQYPVGHKRTSEETNLTTLGSADELKEQNYECCFEPSSSKSNLNPQSPSCTPVGSSQSTSSDLSSSIACRQHASSSDDDNSNNLKTNCDDNCCLSPPESDAQLEKLIAEFGPSMDCQDTSATAGSSSETQTDVPRDDKHSSHKNHESLRDETILEELLMKQTQQLLHRLFVAISGVADQLQSNFASDLRFILRHIFSSEIDGVTEVEEDDDQSEDREHSNTDNSESSLPIEQAIEAQEVTNLIDLESDYSLNSPYDYDNVINFMAPASSNYSHTDNQHSGEAHHHSNSSLTTRDSNNLDANHQRDFQDSATRDINNELLADIMRIREGRAAARAATIYDSGMSPNDASIMDDQRRRQLLLQQHHHISSRSSTRTPSSRPHRNGHTSESSVGQEVSRRSRHGGSRSRRMRAPPVWVPDQLVAACSFCNSPFTLFRRRHHCRACGQIFCANCSKFTKNLNYWGYNEPVRVCESCYLQP